MLSSALFLMTLFSAGVAQDTLSVYPVGELENTQHQVAGYLYAYNQSTLIMDGFSFDGLGIGVFFNVALEGENRGDYRFNRVILGWPDPFEAVPIEQAFDNELIYIDLPPAIKVSDIKWFSVWCEAFGLSFGEVDFPKGEERLFADEI